MKLKNTLLASALLTTATLSAHAATELTPEQAAALKPYDRVVVTGRFNAIGDAVQGTDRKGLIKVRTEVEGAFVHLAISDTGGGIPAEIHGLIFDPFFTTKEVGRGTGQGLAIVRSVVVDKHGGTLTFDTKMGEGTTFRVSLPS